MKRCVPVIFSFVMLMLPHIGLGLSFPVDGYLLSSSGTPVWSSPVMLEYPGANGGWVVDTTTTDSSGYFSFGTVTTMSQGAMLVYATCSFASSAMDTLMFTPATLGWTITLLCGGGNTSICSAQFSAFTSAGITYLEADTSSNSGSSVYSWNLGDGNAATGAFVYHTYANPGTYQVCLTVTDTASNCSDSICQNVVILGGGNSCQAAFSYQTSGATQVAFSNQSIGVTPNSSYFWDLGDGTTSTAQSPVHSYSAPGTYTVCLVIMSATCVDTVCQSVSIGNLPGCDASFSVSTNLPGGVAVFSANAPVSGAFYILDPGDGSTPVTGFPPLTHVYSSSGVYTACMTVIDSLANCSAVFCDSVTISLNTPGTCQAYFDYIALPGSGSFAFFDSSSSSSGNISYSWDFGDNNQSSVKYPVHSYNSPGPWNVCLTITDSSGCMDTYCELVFPVNTPGTYSVNGVIVTDSLLGTQSIVYLIEHDNVMNTLTAIDSQFASFGYYQFNNVQPGTYLVKAGLTPNSPSYSSYLPTYHGGVLTWNTAISTVVTMSDVWNLPIALTQGNNPGGPAFIGGLISQGANKNGDPLSDISVLLSTIGEDPVTHTLTDDDGEYQFDNLAYGTYIVHVEIAGKVAEDWIVTLDANNPSFTMGDFDVNSDHIDAVGTTSMATGLDPASVRIYPNPSDGLIQVTLDLEDPTARVELRNSLGSVIETVESRKGMATLGFDLSHLASGVYLVQVLTDRGSVSYRVMKK